MDAALLSDQQVVFSQPEARLDQFDDGDQRLILLMQDLEEEFDEQLNVRKALAEVENFEIIVLVLSPQFIQLAHERHTIHGEVQNVAFRSHLIALVHTWG